MHHLEEIAENCIKCIITYGEKGDFDAMENEVEFLKVVINHQDMPPFSGDLYCDKMVVLQKQFFVKETIKQLREAKLYADNDEAGNLKIALKNVWLYLEKSLLHGADPTLKQKVMHIIQKITSRYAKKE